MLKRIFLCIIMVTVMVVCGCATSTDKGGGMFGGLIKPEKEVVVLPERAFIDRSDVPGDVEHVTAAIINVLRGGKETIPNVGFDPEGEHQFLKESFSYEAFDVRFVEIIYYKTEMPVDNARYTVLEGGLYFADVLGRTSYVKFVADYVISQKDIIIVRTEYELLPDPYPEVRAFIVPRDIIEYAPASVKNSFLKLYALAVKNAVSMKPTPEDKRRYEQYQQLSFMQRLRYASEAVPKSYCVLVFCMERLRPESQFCLSVSRSPDASEESGSTPYYIDDRGWRMGLVAGKFAIDVYNKEIFFNMQVSPGIDPKQDELKQVARFSSIKDYKQIKKPDNPYIASLKRQGYELGRAGGGSIESGKMFLNPSVTKDAMIIQRRLADFGFYTMKIDGDFGPGSRRSLQAFKKARGLGSNSLWDIKTQKELFRGSGL